MCTGGGDFKVSEATMTKRDEISYEFGPFRLDAPERRLMREGEVVPLAPKVFDTLVALVEVSGSLIDKDELMTRLWPDTFVEEGTLARNISDLRKALGESSGSGKYIETVPKRGYRFIASVKPSAGATLIVQRHTRSSVVVEEEIEAENGVRSIAVLPLKSLGGNESDEYLGLGIADALITRLTNIRQIRVRPTSAVFKYVGLRQEPEGAGRELNVAAVLDGSIQRSSDRIRITVQLVSVKDGSALWAGKFDEKFTDIFTLEDSISEQVAAALTLSLTGEEWNQLKKRYTHNMEAHQAYFKGLYYWNKRTGEGLKRGLECFQQALAEDENYALAYVGLADTFILFGNLAVLPPREAFSRAKQAAMRALEIDEELAEAHSSLGYAKWSLDWDWPGAEQQFARAIELNPGYATAHQWYSLFLAAMGRADEAIVEARRAEEADPVSLVVRSNAGMVLYLCRRYDDAIEQCRTGLEMDPNFYLAQLYAGWAYDQKGMHDEAIASVQKALTLSARGMLPLGSLAYSHALSNERGDARRILAEFGELAERTYVPALYVAVIHAALGETDEAFQWLERAYDERSNWLTLLKVDPRIDSLRSDGRFEELLGRIGLQP